MLVVGSTGNKPAPTSRRNCHGGIAVEFVFVAPILLALMAGAFELSRIIFNYQVALSAAYEGARAGSQMDPASLAPGCFGTEELTYDGASASSPQRLVMERVQYLLNLQGSAISLESPEISTEVVKVTEGQQATAGTSCGNTEKENTIAIKIRGYYQPAIFSFFSIPLTVESRAYLLANNNTFTTTSNPNPSGSCGGISSGSYKAPGTEAPAQMEAGSDVSAAAARPDDRQLPSKQTGGEFYVQQSASMNDLCTDLSETADVPAEAF